LEANKMTRLPTIHGWYHLLVLGCLAGALLSSSKAAEPAKPSERDVARRIDAALIRQRDPSIALPAISDDATFLRRVSLDLAGKLPNAIEIERFVADRATDKRAALIDHLIASDGFAINWGRYWRDVLTYHTPASGNYLRWQLFDQWLVDQVRRNRPWNDIVTALVTATGINDECAPVNYLTAQFGNPVEIAATTSRVFLGQQLQCAQCHDAKSEPWKRDQFHEFVAFFGRARLVQHKDVAGRGTPYAIEGRSEGQYEMTAKKDPSRLIPMAPRFLTGEAIPMEASDTERRQALARFLTSAQNPWFAKAYVNRMWTALMGWGFYATVNDLGSAQTPQYGEVLDLVAREWVATGYDMRWLFRTLAATETYQRGLQPRPASSSAPAPAICPCRLRPEQIFEALVKALGVDENDKNIPAAAPSSAPAVARHAGLRHMVYQAFRIDPSLPVEEVQGTIPQALLMMNSALVNISVASKGKTFLAEALTQGKADDDILVALYERTLARKPRPEEMDICRRYVRRVGDRREALEDVFWSLINSTEFLTKR
jgi:hypothetical protein